MANTDRIIEPRSPSFFWEVVTGFRTDGCTLLAAAISFYALLSVIPLIFLGVAFLGYIVGSSEGAVERVTAVITELLPVPVVDRIADLLHTIIATRVVASVLAFLTFLWVANGAFETVERAVNIIRRTQVTRGYFHRKLIGFFIMLTSGTLLLLSFLISPLLLVLWSMTSDLLRFFPVLDPYVARVNAALAPVWDYMVLPLPFFLMGVVFLLIYLVAPAQPVPLPSAILGTCVASVLWQGARELYSYYLLYYAPHDRLYGPLGAMIGLVLWIYCTAVILLFGAEVADVHARRRARKRARAGVAG
jgi:membrane protein